jgi:hypothetical protein
VAFQLGGGGIIGGGLGGAIGYPVVLQAGYSGSTHSVFVVPVPFEEFLCGTLHLQLQQQ